MVDIHSNLRPLRLGEEKKKEKRNHRMKIYTAYPITQGGHKKTENKLEKATAESNKTNQLCINKPQ